MGTWKIPISRRVPVKFASPLMPGINPAAINERRDAVTLTSGFVVEPTASSGESALVRLVQH